MLDLALKVKKGRERHIKETHHILDTIRLLLLHCKYVYTAKALKYSRSAVKVLYSNTKNKLGHVADATNEDVILSATLGYYVQAYIS